MIPNSSQAEFMVDSPFTGIRPTSVPSPDLRDLLPIVPSTIVSFFLRSDIPLDKIRVCSYALSIDPDKATRAIPIDVTGDARHGQGPTSEMEQPTRTRVA